ncbi:hypothetical protein Tco_0290070 [Tanacetum coccineum]
MASFDYRLNPIYTIKEYSSCGTLYTKDHCCSKGGLVDKFVHDPNNTPDSSQRPPHNCPKCGNPVDGLYCRGCALLRKKLKEVWFTICDENKIFKDILNTSESSNDNTNVVNAPQEPFQLPIIDPTPLEESMKNLLIAFQAWSESIRQKNEEEEKRIAEEQAAKARYWKIPICYDDDDDKESSIPLRDIIISKLPPCIAITPVLSTEEPVDSLIMEDGHLNTIPATESDEVIKSSVEDLVPIPSESEGIPNTMCDVPFCDNTTPLEAFKERSEIVVDSNDDDPSSDDDSPYSEGIDYVNASPPDSELVSLEVVEYVAPEDGELEDDVLREKLSKINLLIAKIEALKDNPTPSSDFVTKSPSTSPNFFLEETGTFDNSLPESETFSFNIEEKSSGQPQVSTLVLIDSLSGLWKHSILMTSY